MKIFRYQFLKVYKVKVPNSDMSTVQRHKTRKLGKKQYYKYVIVIPEEVIKKADLNEGDIVSAHVLGKGKIMFKFKKRKEFSY